MKLDYTYSVLKQKHTSADTHILISIYKNQFLSLNCQFDSFDLCFFQGVKLLNLFKSNDKI